MAAAMAMDAGDLEGAPPELEMSRHSRTLSLSAASVDMGRVDTETYALPYNIILKNCVVPPCVAARGCVAL